MGTHTDNESVQHLLVRVGGLGTHTDNESSTTFLTRKKKKKKKKILRRLDSNLRSSGLEAEADALHD